MSGERFLKNPTQLRVVSSSHAPQLQHTPHTLHPPRARNTASADTDSATATLLTHILLLYLSPTHSLLTHIVAKNSQNMPTTSVPVKLLHEAEGHTITIEMVSGEVYRGKEYTKYAFSHSLIKHYTHESHANEITYVELPSPLS